MEVADSYGTPAHMTPIPGGLYFPITLIFYHYFYIYRLMQYQD
jgi:hypothetical protein